MKQFAAEIMIASVLLMLISCKEEKPAPDPKDARIQNLEKQVAALSGDVQNLHNKISMLQEQLTEIQSAQTRAAAQAASSSRSEMNIERVKQEVAPLLLDAIEKVKKETDTSKKGSQFGMRTEYDPKRAVYGLVRNDNPEVPYYARVIVSYQKYLVSSKESKEMSTGATRFLFAYRKGRWTFEKVE
jgi:TolA-binding protein